MAAWSSIVEEAERWARESELGYSVSGAEEEERKITLKSGRCSFYVTVPDVIGTGEWGVWSDDDRCVASLGFQLDSLILPSNGLTEVLTKTCAVLRSAAPKDGEELSDGEEGEEEEEEDEDEDGDDDFDAYYGEGDDSDVEVLEKSPAVQDVSADDFFTGQGTPAAVHRLLSDLKMMKKSSSKYGISGLPREDNLFIWDVRLSDFEQSSMLQRDLESYARQHGRDPVLEMEMKFPKDYPMNPPFVRIIRPRFQFLTGHVTVGGSICMQMLTRSGWSPSNDIESILVQVRAEIMSDPKARLDPNPLREYTEAEARDAFERMVRRYGWGR